MFPGLTGTNRSDTLIEMLCGILIYGVVGQLAILVFLNDKASLSIGWWIGVATALASGYHMWWGLDRALSFGEKDAVKLVTSYNMLRYAAIVVIMGVIMVTEIGNPLAAVFGVFGLKAGAYMQPLIHKFNKKTTEEKEVNV